MAKPMTTKDKIREWISDNLRYILLILGILAVVGVILLIVHLVSSASENGKNSGGSSAAVSNVSRSAESDSGTADDSTAGASSAVSGSSEAAGSESAPLVFGPDNQAEVTSVAAAYFQGLAARDMDAIRAVTDHLSAEEEAEIAAQTKVKSYDGISVYTVTGPEEGTYLAVVSYTCTYEGIATPLPMLSELYLYHNAEGNLVIMEETDDDAAVTEAMQKAMEQDEVKALISQVQKSYDDALASDAQLKAYVESIQ